MGLESFSSDDSGFDGNTTSTTKTTSTSTNHDDDHKAYKIIWNGKNTLPIENNEIVIHTEEEWNEIIEFVSEHMNISIKEFNTKTKERKYNLVEKAVEVLNGNKRELYGEKQHCQVCDKEFQFPEDWNFVKFDNFVCCANHKISEVVQKYEEEQSEI